MCEELNVEIVDMATDTHNSGRELEGGQMAREWHWRLGFFLVFVPEIVGLINRYNSNTSTKKLHIPLKYQDPDNKPTK